ncbi:hypothetical protein DRQ17_06580, partial [bacterium]
DEGSVQALGNAIARIDQGKLVQAKANIHTILTTSDESAIKSAADGLISFVDHLDSIGFIGAVANVILDENVSLNKNIDDIPGMRDTLLTYGFTEEMIDSIESGISYVQQHRNEILSDFGYRCFSTKDVSDLAYELKAVMKGNLNEVKFIPMGTKAISMSCIAAILGAIGATGAAAAGCYLTCGVGCYFGAIGAAGAVFGAYLTCRGSS